MFVSRKSFSVIALLLLFVVKNGTTLKCYVCDSATDPNCISKLSDSMLVDCSQHQNKAASALKITQAATVTIPETTTFETETTIEVTDAPTTTPEESTTDIVTTTEVTSDTVTTTEVITSEYLAYESQTEVEKEDDIQQKIDAVNRLKREAGTYTNMQCVKVTNEIQKKEVVIRQCADTTINNCTTLPNSFRTCMQCTEDGCNSSSYNTITFWSIFLSLALSFLSYYR